MRKITWLLLALCLICLPALADGTQSAEEAALAFVKLEMVDAGENAAAKATALDVEDHYLVEVTDDVNHFTLIVEATDEFASVHAFRREGVTFPAITEDLWLRLRRMQGDQRVHDLFQDILTPPNWDVDELDDIYAAETDIEGVTLYRLGDEVTWDAAALIRRDTMELLGWLDLTDPAVAYDGCAACGQVIRTAAQTVEAAYGAELMPHLTVRWNLFVTDEGWAFVENESLQVSLAFWVVTFVDDRANYDEDTYVPGVENFQYPVVVNATDGTLIEMREPEGFGYGRIPSHIVTYLG